MGLKRCKLTRKVQLRLLEFFVLEVTARSAADVLDLQPNTVALFYRKVRDLIVEQAARNEELLGGEVEVDESYFGGVRKGKHSKVLTVLSYNGKKISKKLSNKKIIEILENCTEARGDQPDLFNELEA
jgi:transposase